MNTSNFNFYFDYLSPFSYFLWTQFREKNFTQVKYKPVVLARLLKHWGQKGPAEIEPKKKFLARYCENFARENNIPFLLPKAHPFNPLIPLRMSVQSIYTENPALQFKVIDLLWKAIWVDQVTADDPEKIAEYLSQQGLEGSQLVEMAFNREYKNELNANTKEAIEFGCFGVPSIIYNDQLFWGNDSFKYFCQTYEK
jgi:2-hydroxychromene-2-carboxylate isomerase